MIRVLGGPKQLCDGITRRDLLQVGSLGMLGLGLTDPFAASALASEGPGKSVVNGRFGQAKACIFLFLYGSPSQLETFDPKPDAPEQIRGELKSIPSRVPGLDVCELLPQMAGVMDKVTVLRSVSHPYPLHGVAYAATGVPSISAPMELNPRDPAHWPYIGSVVDYVDSSRAAKSAAGVDRSGVSGNLVLPWAFSSQRIGEVARAGPYGGYLGQKWDPVSTLPGRHPREPFPPRSRRRPRTGPHARPARPPSDASGTA